MHTLRGFDSVHGDFDCMGGLLSSPSHNQAPVDRAIPGMREIIWRARAVKKRKKQRFEAGKEARRRARASGLAPSATRVIPDKRKRSPKHKGDLLEGET
jgi:hypothetical protein